MMKYKTNSKGDKTYGRHQKWNKERGRRNKGLAGLAGTAFAVAATVANTALTNARIQNNEAKIKELSKGFGRFTNSEEIDTLKRQNASLREKMNKDSK